MNSEARGSFDQPYWDWSPAVGRPLLKWPRGAKLAVCLLVDLGHYEWQPAEKAFDPPTHTPPMGVTAYPDYVTVTHREYGHRVGIFRIFDALDRLGIRATVPMDAHTATHYPSLVEECLQRRWEIMAHGLTQRQAITSRMSEGEEREYIAKSLAAIREATGRAPLGWLGPEHSQSTRTPNLLASQGIRYCCDFANDEQPYKLHTDAGDLCALPCMIELTDTIGHFNRKLALHRWAAMVKEAFDVMLADADTGLLLVWRVHPWCVGQPHRIRYFEDVVSHMARAEGVWMATGAEICNWYNEQPHARQP